MKGVEIKRMEDRKQYEFIGCRVFKLLGICAISGIVYSTTISCGGFVNTAAGLAFILSGLISGLWIYNAFLSRKDH